MTRRNYCDKSSRRHENSSTLAVTATNPIAASKRLSNTEKFCANVTIVI
ncbi:MAG: hypothetical protein IJ685_11555 [Selenomonadaceae bacterium]|nr:hypothetical protein [Selenomonadaceae bacterium]